MAGDIQTSLHGRKVGLDQAGRLLLNPTGAGTMAAPVVAANAVAGSGATAGGAVSFTAERAFANGYYTIPANTLQVGSLIRVKYQGICVATHSTDTLAVNLKLGVTLAATTLAATSGTTLLGGTATNVADSDTFWGEYELAIRTIGSSGTLVGMGIHKAVPAAEATVTIVDDILASTAIDTTIDQILAVTATWGVSDAGNQARLDFFRVLVG